MRNLFALFATALLLATACGESGSAPAPAQYPSVAQCALSSLLRIDRIPESTIERALQTYALVELTTSVEGALTQVFGKELSEFDRDELDEAILILRGLDACGEVSPQLKEATSGALGILGTLNPVTSDPGSGAPAQALCQGDRPFDDSPDRIQPNCGEFSLEGSWQVLRSTVACDGLTSCDARPVILRFEACSDTTCEMSRTDDVWRDAHPVVLTAPDSWSAQFEDVGVLCGENRNLASFDITVNVTGKDVVDGLPVATQLQGTYVYAADSNPPDCRGGRASFTFTAERY